MKVSTFLTSIAFIFTLFVAMTARDAYATNSSSVTTNDTSANSVTNVSNTTVSTTTGTITQINIQGSTTILPILEKATKAYSLLHPEIHITLLGEGTISGIKALFNNACDIAMLSRTLTAEEVAFAKEKNIKPLYVRIGTDAVLPIVNPNNIVDDITPAQLKAVFTGKIVNWKELGGHDIPIVVISRRIASGTCQVWSEVLLNNAKITPLSLLQASNNSIVKTVSVNPNAIGYIASSYLTASIKPLTINGVKANEESVQNHEWLTSRDLYLLTNDQPSKAIEEFIAFLLDPEYGQIFVELAGCYKLPVETR